MGYTRPSDGGAYAGRTREIKRVLLIILVLNVLVAVAKIVWGIVTRSAAMQADGTHSLFDGASNVVGLVGISLAARPADRTHPYGHRKFETYASAVIAGMLVAAAYRVGSSAIAQLAGGAHPTVGAGSFVVMVGTLCINIGVTTWERRVGRRLGSELLLADASHTRSDVLVSLGVLVSLVLVRAGLTRADGVVALLVVAAIVHTAWGVIKQVSVTLSDAARIAPEDIARAVLDVPGVLGCHHIRTRGSEDAVYVDLHVQVDESRSVADGHRIAEEVERAISSKFPQVADVIAHLEPFDEYQFGKTERENGAHAR